MKQIMARDCLYNGVQFVHEEERPHFDSEYFAVFKDKKKKKLSGLVEKSDIIHPNRIFADLRPKLSLNSINLDTPAEICEEKMRLLGVNVLPVFDENNHFRGIVTYRSITSGLRGQEKPSSSQNDIKLFDALMQVLHGVEHYHDSFTLVHEINTGKMMSVMGRALGYDETYCNHLEQTGSLHDLGKVALPANILEKPCILSPFEREVMELHPHIGSKVFKKIDHPLAELAAKINLYHHESYDGNGYPFGLKKDQIPLEARICSLCDVYDAIRSHRPYRKDALDHKTVVKMILSKKGDGLFYHFDPMLLEVFSEIHEEFDKIFCEGLKLNYNIDCK